MREFAVEGWIILYWLLVLYGLYVGLDTMLKVSDSERRYVVSYVTSVYTGYGGDSK